MNIKEESLRKALEAVGLSSLPKQLSAHSEGFWLKAIVLVQKRNMEECYCLYDRNPSGLMKIARDFGSASVVYAVKSIHPYLYFDDRRFIPSDMSLEDKRLYLLHELDKDDEDWYNVPKMDESQINRVIFEHGVSRQLANLDEDVNLNTINEEVDENLADITEEDEKKYRSDLFAMIREGRSQDEINAFREDFERRKEAQEERRKNAKMSKDAESKDVISEADELRDKMEGIDEERLREEEPMPSKAGEFDEPKIDYAKLKADTEEYRHEQIKASKRRWKREYDSMQRGEPMVNDSAFENELGEIEGMETLQLPENQQPKGVKPASQPSASRKIRKTSKAVATKRKSVTTSKRRTTKTKENP